MYFAGLIAHAHRSCRIRDARVEFSRFDVAPMSALLDGGTRLELGLRQTRAQTMLCA
jgi:hypothetical protein